MRTQQQFNTLSSLVQRLKFKNGDLAMLVETAIHQNMPYDFFRTLAAHLIPFIRKGSGYQTLVKRWTREIRAGKEELHDLKERAVQEVTEAYNKLSKKLEGSQLLSKIEGLKNLLEETKRCLDNPMLPIDYDPKRSQLPKESKVESHCAT